jgi:hypothetical protein
MQELTPLSAALLAAIGTAVACGVLWRHSWRKQLHVEHEQLGEIRRLEKELHVKERDFLAERNSLDVKHAEDVRAARGAAFEEGRRLGSTEASAAHLGELTNQRSALVARFEKERDDAVHEAREKLRSEFELQTKLFTVRISPYVSIKEGKGLINHDHETITGYQYQLLVNGIPAFAPHVVAEQTEVKKNINPEVERLLIESAKRAADAAIDVYLGGSTQFAKLAEPIVRRLPK